MNHVLYPSKNDTSKTAHRPELITETDEWCWRAEFADQRLPTHLACSRMKRVEAKILENEPEDPRTEPDQEPNTWLIQGKLSEDVLDWENVRLDFVSSEIEAEIIESSLSNPSRFTIRTSGRSPLKKGDLVHVDIR
jgi:hypothetical protein